MTYRFGDFEVDVLAYELRQRGQPVRLARQPMDLLLLLLDRRQELVSREDIANRLWGPDIHIDIEAGIHTAILKIRQVLGVSRELPPFVETVPGKGYRFVAPVDVVTQPDRKKSPALFGTPPRPFDALPAELTSFVGRRQACLELPEILASARLLSLTGGGGVGKTRLAVRLARDLIDRFADGVWFVDLGSLSMPDLIAQTIATTIGIREGPQRSARESLLETLRDRELLLVLDTCEHLLDDCADIVEDLLRRAPTLRIVTTSREALGVSGEIVYRVPSLTMPDASISVSVDALAEFEATRLFMERARGVDPTFVAAADNAAAIAGLCRRLDGIPLAIELAAARVAVLSPEQIEARLEDRFRLLTGGARTVVARQRTLEATVDWSYQLLSDVERHLLCRLAVFPASWTIEAAEQICSGNRFKERDVLDLLSRLVGKSLVVTESDSGAMRRYRLPETVRQYARRRLVDEGDADRLGEQHFEHFFTEFRGALPILRHHDQVRCLRRLRIEQENVRAALDWALTSVSHAEKGVELAGALFWFWTKRGLYQEGRLWLERALAVRSDVHQRLRARALIGLAHMDHFQGRSFVGTAAEALRLGREADDAWVISFALFLQALGALATGDHEAAAQLSLDAQAAASLCGDEVQLAGPLLILANIAVANGDYGRAQRLYDDAIAVERRAGEIWGLTIVLSAAAGLGILREDFEGARAQASEVLCLSQQLEDPRGIAWSLEVSAGLMVAGGHSDNAAQLWGASDRLLEAVGGLLSPEIRWIRDRYIDCAKASLGTQAFESLRNDGRAMPIDRAIALTQQHARLVG